MFPGTLRVIGRISAVMINKVCAFYYRQHGRVIGGVTAVGVAAYRAGRLGKPLMRYDRAVLRCEITALLYAVVFPLRHVVEIGSGAVQMVSGWFLAEQEPGAWHTVMQRECGYGK